MKYWMQRVVAEYMQEHVSTVLTISQIEGLVDTCTSSNINMSEDQFMSLVKQVSLIAEEFIP